MEQQTLESPPVEQKTGPAWLTLSDSDLVEQLEQCESFLQGEAAKLKTIADDAKGMRAEILRRCAGKQLPHARYIIRAVRKKTLQKTDYVFKELEQFRGQLPDAEINAAYCVRTVEEMHTDARKLNKLADQYTGEIGNKLRDIRDRALVYVEGPETLEMLPRNEQVKLNG